MGKSKKKLVLPRAAQPRSASRSSSVPNRSSCSFDGGSLSSALTVPTQSQGGFSPQPSASLVPVSNAPTLEAMNSPTP